MKYISCYMFISLFSSSWILVRVKNYLKEKLIFESVTNGGEGLLNLTFFCIIVMYSVKAGCMSW